jgi:SWI/SNF-related matrix-associated actin-dependent regulator 1 of chromatin subfamily A
MALTQIIRQQCTTCNKIAVEQSRLKIGKTLIIKLACGHILHSTNLEQSTTTAYDSIIFADGCKPRPYQIDAIKFAEESDVRLIIADEAGLGKTIESAGLLRLHPNELLPAAIVCPSTVKLQWMYELRRICDTPQKKFLVQVIQSGKEKAMPGFDIYVITYDMLKNDDVFTAFLPENTIKTIIIDECQRIKNHLSDRAKAVQRVARRAKHIIAMSGTPIKNNAGEYFTVLNLVKPTMFPHYQRYIDNYCDAYNNGWSQKIGGLKDAARFHEDTKDIIIRRTKAEVLKDLPSIERKFHHVELDKKLNKVYATLMQELEDSMYGEGNETMMVAIAIMSKMRHICGISKVAECVDFVTEFLLSTDRKIVIFSHHQDVMEMLRSQLDSWCVEGDFGKPLTLHSGLNGDERTRLVTEFRENPTRRVMIASTLAAGEGLNLQFCSDAILLERQWNPANEEQVEGRFHRFGQLNNVGVTYMIASGTIDDFFTELVEIKRSIVAATLDNKQIEWNQQSLMRELAGILLTRGKKAWSL